MNTENKRITIKNLMTASGFSRDTIIKLTSQGMLPHSRDMNNWRIYKPECIDLVIELAGVKRDMLGEV